MRYYVVISQEHEHFLIVAESKKDAIDVCFDKAIEIKKIFTLKCYTQKQLGSSYLSDIVSILHP